MSYFDTYLKRVNRYGNNLQERIQGKKEHDFEVFKMKSPNLVRARNGEEDLVGYDAVLQTKEYDEDEVVDYLLVSLNQEIPMGTIIYTKDQRHKKVMYEEKEYTERRWINYAIDPYTSTGYNRYTVVELESELSWVDEGVKYSSYAHATGGGSGARDKNINAKFKVQFAEAGVYLPNKRYSIVMPTHPALKKNMKVTLGGETWKVAGFDNISVKGVSYVTLEETLLDEMEDLPVANANQFNNWTVTTSLGENFSIVLGRKVDFELLFFYNGEQKNDIKYHIINSNDIFSINQIDGNNVSIIASAQGQTNLKIVIDGWEQDKAILIPFSVQKRFEPSVKILGSEIICVGESNEYNIRNVYEEELLDLYLENNNAQIISREYLENATAKVVIKGINIGKNKIIIPQETEDYEFELNIKSIWLGGN
jgi:hypothetical protein